MTIIKRKDLVLGETVKYIGDLDRGRVFRVVPKNRMIGPDEKPEIGWMWVCDGTEPYTDNEVRLCLPENLTIYNGKAVGVPTTRFVVGTWEDFNDKAIIYAATPGTTIESVLDSSVFKELNSDPSKYKKIEDWRGIAWRTLANFRENNPTTGRTRAIMGMAKDLVRIPTHMIRDLPFPVSALAPAEATVQIKVEVILYDGLTEAQCLARYIEFQRTEKKEFKKVNFGSMQYICYASGIGDYLTGLQLTVAKKAWSKGVTDLAKVAEEKERNRVTCEPQYVED